MIQNDGDQYGYKNIKNALLERTASENVIVEYRSGIFSSFSIFIFFLLILLILLLLLPFPWQLFSVIQLIVNLGILECYQNSGRSKVLQRISVYSDNSLDQILYSTVFLLLPELLLLHPILFGFQSQVFSPSFILISFSFSTATSLVAVLLVLLITYFEVRKYLTSFVLITDSGWCFHALSDSLISQLSQNYL